MLKTEDKTKTFLEKYLAKGPVGPGQGLYGMVADSRGTDKRRLAAAIRRMDYHAFVQTRYWRLVSLQVKRAAGWHCESCGRGRDLVAHHVDYRCHGYEMYHPDKLKCLCGECHRSLHGIR